MSFKFLTHPLRSLLVKLHPYFSCCASCGEIKIPVGGRLCTSLVPDFSVDSILIGGTDAQAAAVKQRMPWLRRVHVADAGTEVLHNLPDLAENFFVAFADSRLNRFNDILDLFTPNGIPLLAARKAEALPPAEMAFCTFLEERGFVSGREASFASDIYPFTKECVTTFTPVFAEFVASRPQDAPDSFVALSRWAYASALAIPAGPLHPLLCHE